MNENWLFFSNIRHEYLETCWDFREAEFICVCDINKEAESTIKDLNDGQINVVHINATAKNAADDKIRQSLRRFSDSHPPGTKVILISSDVNFASDLSDLRHRKKFEVVLIHKAQVSEALLTCATEHYLYEDIIKDLPDRPGYKEVSDNVLVAYGYSKDCPDIKVKQVLKMLSNNCGGRVISIGPLFAILKFETPEFAERAKKRMNGEEVFGRKITVCLPEETPFFNTVKKLLSSHTSKRQESPSPQRRPGRERNNSRSYTPNNYDSGFGYQNGSNYLLGDNYSDENDVSQLSEYQFTPKIYDLKSYKTPGGPVVSSCHVPTASANSSSSSPNHTHTLPNSNSEKYYHIKSKPSSLDGSPFNNGSACDIQQSSSVMSGPSFPLGDLNKVTSGCDSTAVFKRKLSDIPIPSFGFRDIPPPPIKYSAETKSLSCDPIQLVENASKDSTTYIMSSSSGLDLTPHPDLQTPPSQPAVSLFGGHQNTHFNSSQGSAFTKLQPVSLYQNHIKQPYSQHHQPRSMSVPVHNNTAVPKDKLASENELSPLQGYPPANTFRSQSQNAGVFKKPISPQKTFNRNHLNSGSYSTSNCQSSPRVQNSSQSNGKDHLRHSFSSDGEDRPYSPSGNSSSNIKAGFRPRLPSAPLVSLPNSRTPSPFSCPSSSRPRSKQHGSNLYRVPTPDEIGEPSTDYINPEFNPDRDSYVELIVSNLDYNIQPREWRKIIYATFFPHVKILSIHVRLQADNTSMAVVRLVSEQDARFAITQFHRRKIGYKRINVQFKTDTSQSPAESLRTDTIALLMETKENKMALAQLIDRFDKRFHKSVSVSDIYKMRDIIQVIESGGAGRWVKLQPGICRSPTPVQNADGELSEVLEQPVCPIHCVEGSLSYTEALNSCMLPNVQILRKHFAPQLHSLLLSHNGYIPLMSFPACYTAEFQPIEACTDGGIPLEHVISCVPGVEITVSKIGVKMIQFQENREQFYDMMKSSSWQELGKISREVMELLRQQSNCIMPVSRFIPAYHHYFGRQCRVADYGYTKLQELFEAIPHAIQILGTGDRKAITLSPRAQLKRFTTDILKVVKAQPAKQVMLDHFPPAYERVLNKPLYLPHYGVCFMEDVLMDIPTTTLIVIEEGNQTLLALPRRDQTPEEVERTKQFALEVVDLLKQNPQCKMPFNKFIPAYHHHFGRQCRVADYGFSKLGDLFEAVCHIVEIEEDGEEKFIHLCLSELRKVLCDQLTTLITPHGFIPLHKLLSEYGNQFGFNLKLEDFKVNSLKALLQKLKSHIKIEVRNGQEVATLVKESQIPKLGLQVMQLLMDESGGSLPLMELTLRYESLFGVSCDVDQIREELSDYIQIDEEEGDSGGVIRLTTQQMLGRNLRLLLLHKQRISMSDLPSMYKGQYGVELTPALYGFSSLYQLLLSFSHILDVKGKPTQKYIVLSSVLSVPGTLPPARVDLKSPTQTNSYQDQNGSPTQGLELLRHASNLWDPRIASQGGVSLSSNFLSNTSPPVIATKIMEILNSAKASASVSNNEKVSSCLISPDDIPETWQMKAGADADKMCRGTIGLSVDSETNQNLSPQHSCETVSQTELDSRTSPHGSLPCDVAAGEEYFCDDLKEEDLFSPNNLPLETSSTTSSQHNSSHSSTNSPIKRRPRIAANFNMAS
ncbi:meiosis arrest female protein 1 [Biomphalaria glabrata]|nr:meiosis arrest female protein 1 [Biomphalaria glabrata]